MRRRKKVASLRRKREAQVRAIADEKARKEEAAYKTFRRKRLKEWKDRQANEFWVKYLKMLKKDVVVGQGNKKLEATPCVKKRSVIDPY